MSDKPIPPHAACFFELTDVQQRQFQEHGMDAGLAAAIAIGEAAKAIVRSDRREAVSELAAELMQRFAMAVAVMEAPPAGEA